MAAIIETRTTSYRSNGPLRPLRPSGAPRHLSTIPLPVAGGDRDRSFARAQAIELDEPLLSRATVAAMVAAVVLAALLALAIGSGAFSSLVPTPGSEPISASEGRVVVVEPGDSVWSIARFIQPDGDLRPLVHRIVQANGAGPIQPGQQLVVPV